MENAESAAPKQHRKGRDKIAWLFIAGLFLLRVPFLGGMRTLTWTATSYWVMPIFEVGTYLLTAILIWSERDRLPDNHIDRLALIILILGKPVELLLSKSHNPFGRPLRSSAYLLYLPIAVALVVGLALERPRMARTGMRKWLWVAAGVLAGIAIGALSGWLTRLEMNLPRVSSLTTEVLILLPIQQLLYAGIDEEPFFRGFLWGALRRAGWKEVWIWVFQGVLFWLAHIYWLDRSPVTFWVIVPLGGLALGALAWRSRSIGVSMIAHGLLNAVLKMVVSYRL
jgi:membrane protease YdiL (CAAX protease family)